MAPSRSARFFTAVAAGVLMALAVGMLIDWTLAPFAGWDVFVVALVALILADFAGDTPDITAEMARKDAFRHSAIDIAVLIASIASIGAVVGLVAGKGAGIVHIIVGLVSILLSWVAVHMLFTLHYVTLYYRDREGGIDFNNKLLKRPRFSDFAYLAFTIGMTYQVSDTIITDYRIRRVVLGHALISFVFGVAIIASTINFLVGLA